MDRQPVYSRARARDHVRDVSLSLSLSLDTVTSGEGHAAQGPQAARISRVSQSRDLSRKTSILSEIKNHERGGGAVQGIAKLLRLADRERRAMRTRRANDRLKPIRNRSIDRQGA